jgi:hypothetical protein
VSAQVPAGEPAAGAARFRSTFRVPGMDCPSEEVQIRAALGELAQGLRFDLPGRTLVVDHAVPVGVVLGRLQKLGMGAEPSTAARPPRRCLRPRRPTQPTSGAACGGCWRSTG